MVTKNTTTSDNDIEAVVRDYSSCVHQLGKYADIIVVNVSSPNTPGLRTLQNVEPLTLLLTGVVQAVKQVDRKTKPAIMVKVSPDEDSEDQIAGICEAVWDSGVDGVIVGNTTKKRPDPLPRGYQLPEKEANILLEQGGYSGPQMFERTLALVKKYRKTLDGGPKQPTSESQPVSEKPDSDSRNGDKPALAITDKLETTAFSNTDAVLSSAASAISKTPMEASSEPSPSATTLDDISESAPILSPTDSKTIAPAPTMPGPRKVLFATGGITNGRQAREILDAGASVAMVYTALIYGGVGTITRIKEEMREAANQPKSIER
jgi:dihydroorotate dehydrogenase